ncbi:hypothetical protein [Halalkalibacillus halophilus]|uniref:hypothetical protein n=1 Tax=Halalkalibacillus halophilus TaxID=392827 RepID=UPI00048925F6|nr:hypothetical protein [Halalkalibacillus halophilus]
MKRILLFFIIGSLMFSSACVEENLIEELGIVTAYGFDFNKETNEYDATTVLYQFNPDITDASQIIKSSGRTFQMAKSKANKKIGI